MSTHFMQSRLLHLWITANGQLGLTKSGPPRCRLNIKSAKTFADCFQKIFSQPNFLTRVSDHEGVTRGGGVETMNAYAPLDCPTNQVRTEFQIASTPAPTPNPRLTLFLTMNAEKYSDGHFLEAVFNFLGAFSQFGMYIKLVSVNLLLFLGTLFLSTVCWRDYQKSIFARIIVSRILILARLFSLPSNLTES